MPILSGMKIFEIIAKIGQMWVTACFIFSDHDLYLQNHCSEHRLVACRWIQNDERMSKIHISILSGMKIFEIIAKIGQTWVTVCFIFSYHDLYLPNHCSEHRLVACRLIQNDERMSKIDISISIDMRIFKIITKIGQMGLREVKEVKNLHCNPMSLGSLDIP